MLIAALLSAVVLIPSGFYEAKALEPSATYVAQKPATVLCATSQAAWDQYATAEQATDGTNALTPVGGSQSEFSPVICASLLARLHHRPVGEFKLAASMLILVHESIHQRGVSDEGQTECAAIHEMPRVAVKFFGVKPGVQLRTLMMWAWASHRVKPTPYTSVC